MIIRIIAALVGVAFIGFYFLALNDPELFGKLQTESSSPNDSQYSPHFIPLMGLLFLAYAYKGRKLEGYDN
ncbi:MAG: hypothetical protein ACJ0BN_00375 [Limisphaerales bacterium]|nr:hypothetical protein [Verrucomicrobiales bacterium]|tara:strand:+ start:743 stop:955 length:213 start_codon:yes stop_codon:yes gene_type:complete